MKNTKLNRYTSLPILLDILSKSELTLLDPSSWEDRNDSFYIELYKKRKKLKSVLALCFTTKTETFHHWKVFSDGPSGVCIQFKKDELIKSVKRIRGVEADYVQYCQINDLRSNPPELEELPFLKRYPYRHEGEFRIIYKIKSKELSAKSVPFNLESIIKINLSPWLPDPIVETVNSFIKQTPGCSKLRVSKTTLVESKVWKNVAIRNIT